MDNSWLHPESVYPGRCFVQAITRTQLKEVYNSADGPCRYRMYNAEGDLVTVEVVRDVEHVQDALDWLRYSAQDPYIGFDLEWRPDTSSYQNNPVALIQLATCDCCVILQTGLWGYLPDEISAFLR